MKKVLIILGMHRSGTSYITHVVKSLGINVGDNLMPAAKGNNEIGFFEDIDINALNIEMLNSLNTSWHKVTQISDSDVEQLLAAGFKERINEIICQKLGNTDLFSFKDPRTTKLLPIWNKALSDSGLSMKYLLMVRNPLSTAQSLKRRDGFFHGKGFLLWLSYVLTALQNTTPDDRVVFDYDFLSSNPESELIRLNQFINQELDFKTEASVDEVFDENQRHFASSTSELTDDPNCPPLVKEIYSTLLDEIITATPQKPETLDCWLESWSGEFERMTPLLKYLDTVEGMSQMLSVEVESLNKVVSGMTKLFEIKGLGN